jgi:hypothetical protein
MRRVFRPDVRTGCYGGGKRQGSVMLSLSPVAIHSMMETERLLAEDRKGACSRTEREDVGRCSPPSKARRIEEASDGIDASLN